MSIEAKTTLMRSIEQNLYDKVTAADIAKIMEGIADSLAQYDVEHIRGTDPARDDLLGAYIAAMKIQGRSPNTVERYRYLIIRMMDAVKIPTRQITVYHLRQYLASEKSRGVSDRTLEGTRQVFSAYFNWLQREGLIAQNPVTNLGAIKCAKIIRNTYTDVDLEKLKFGCRTKRDRAIVAFLASTGCRISEMTQLNREDVDLNGLECRVLGKGAKERTVYLDAVAGMLIGEYLASRNDTKPALFVGKGTDRMTPGGIRRMLVQLADDTGTQNVHPHKFRRTLATNLIRHGMPIQEVASILGHDKLDTTMQYVVLDKTDIKIAYRRYA